MVAPVNRLSNTAAKGRRTAVLDDTTFDTILALRELLAHDDPKVILAAAKIILEFEKARLRHGKQLRHDEPGEEIAFTPEPPQAEPDTKPRPPEPLRVPPFDRTPLGSAGDGGRVGGALKPSIASFLPPKLTGSATAPCPTPPA